MTVSDPWNKTDTLQPTVLDATVNRLEDRGAHALFGRMLNDSVEAMNTDRASPVLDLGCGTGGASRHIARREGFAGEILGIDLSPYLVEAASRLASDEGGGDRLRFEAGDTHGLGIADESFDAVVAHTLLSHINDPLAVLAEEKRVVRAGGSIGVFDGDYASLTFEQDDEAKPKADDEKLISAVVA